MKINITVIKSLKITTFFILGLFLLVFSLIMFFYYLAQPCGESMASFGYLLYFVISLAMIIIDRILVRLLKPSLLSIIEISITLAFLFTIFILHYIGQ
jgi:hypothetical protein